MLFVHLARKLFILHVFLEGFTIFSTVSSNIETCLSTFYNPDLCDFYVIS